MKKEIMLSFLIFCSVTLTQSQTFSELPLDFPGVEGGAAIMGDYDNDGDLDIFIKGTEFTELMELSSLFENRGGTFVEHENFLLNLATCNSPSQWIDYDNDGDLDLYICSDIFSNDNQTFTANNFGFISPSAGTNSWVDYDNDNDMDIVISGSTDQGYKTILYQNNITSFSPTIEFVGLIYTSMDWGDYDNDGDQDLVITGDQDNSGIKDLVCYVYKNEIDSFVIDSANILTGVKDGSAKWGDFDNDGDLDILLSGNSNKTGTVNSVTKIYINENDTLIESEIELIDLHMSNVGWVDINDDMRLDIILTGADNDNNPHTAIYLNDGLGGFNELENSLIDVYYSSMDWQDYDNDEDLDLLISGGTGSGSFTKLYINNLYFNCSTTHTFDTTTCGSYISPSGKVWTVSDTYKDTIPNAVECDSIITINLTIDCPGSLFFNNVLKSSIYPNPVDNKVTIDFKELNSRVLVEIFSMSGQLMVSEVYFNSKQLSIYLNIPKDSYLIKVTNHNGDSNLFKILKQ